MVIPIVGIIIGLLIPVAPILVSPPAPGPEVAAPAPTAPAPTPTPAGVQPTAPAPEVPVVAQPARGAIAPQAPGPRPTAIVLSEGPRRPGAPAPVTAAVAQGPPGRAVLPRTGADLWMPALAGIVLFLAGLLVRRRVRRIGEAVVPAAAHEEFRALSMALIACGILVVLVPAGWMVYTKHAVDETQIQALETWQEAVSQPSTDAAMVLTIPSLDLRRYVPDGASPDQLKQFGVGRITWTTLPDADGAVGIAGHRTTYGAPFFRLDRLRQGDEIAVDFRGQRYTYRVERLETVHPTQVEVLQAQAGERVIALVTCAPAYSAAQRLVVLGRLESVASLGAR